MFELSPAKIISFVPNAFQKGRVRKSQLEDFSHFLPLRYTNYTNIQISKKSRYTVTANCYCISTVNKTSFLETVPRCPKVIL